MRNSLSKLTLRPIGFLSESLVALLFLDVLFNGFIDLCLWFMANFRENLSKLVETLQTSLNEV